MIKQKKLMLLVLCVAMIFSLIIGISICFTTNVQSVSAEDGPVVSIDDAKLKFSYNATDGNPVTIGSDRSTPLQKGESLILSYTLLKGTSSMLNNNGFLISREENLPSAYPYVDPSVAMIFAGDIGNSLDGYGDSVSSKITDAKLGHLYSTNIEYGGQHNVKITYTPYDEDTTNNGLVMVEISSIDDPDNWSIIYKAELLNATIAGPTHRIFLYVNSTFDMTISNYRIYTTNGANMLGIREKEVQGKFIREIGLLYAHGTSSASITPVADKYDQNFTVTTQATFGAPVVEIPENGKLVLRYSVKNSATNTEGNLLGFAFLDSDVPGNYGRWQVEVYLITNGWGTAVNNGGISEKGNAEDIAYAYTAGNTVEFHYTPDWSDDASGSIIMYSVDNEGVLTEKIRFTGIDRSMVFNIASVHFVSTKDTTLTVSDYYVYTEKDGQRSMAFDGTTDEPDFVRALPENVDIVSSSLIPKVTGFAEKTVTVKSSDGSTAYSAYVKKDSNYILPVSTTDGFFKWQIGESFYDASELISVSENIIVEPFTVDISMINGATIRSNKPYGLRFSSEIDYETYNNLNKYAKDIKSGTLILPKDTLIVDFTKDALDNASIKYKNIINDGWTNESTAETDGKYQFHGSLVGILDHNLARTFASVSYLSFTLDGKNYTVYSNQVERSVNQVAKVSLALSIDANIKAEIIRLYIDTVIEISSGTVVEIDGYTNPYKIEIDNGAITITRIDGSALNLKAAIVDGECYKILLSEDQMSAKILFD